MPNGADYDLHVYRFDGTVFAPLAASANGGAADEVAVYDPPPGFDATGLYGIEVRRIAGSSCANYTLKVKDPS